MTEPSTEIKAGAVPEHLSLLPASHQPWLQAGTVLSTNSDLLLKYSSGTVIEPKLKTINSPSIFNRKRVQLL